jgi:hypothetical protein
MIESSNIKRSVGKNLVVQTKDGWIVQPKGSSLATALKVFNNNGDSTRAKFKALAYAETLHMIETNIMTRPGVVIFLHHLAIQKTTPKSTSRSMIDELRGRIPAELEQEIRAITREWPKSTRNSEWPVPDPKQRFHSLKTYQTASFTERWIVGPYAELNLELCAYVAAKLGETK